MTQNVYSVAAGSRRPSACAHVRVRDLFHARSVYYAHDSDKAYNDNGKACSEDGNNRAPVSSI